MFNGTYERTCLVREKDDTFIPFNTDEIICINPSSFQDFVKIVDKKKNTMNILIDSRLEYIILLAFIRYKLELLIYDSYKLTVYSIIEYFSSTMYIESTEISLNDVEKYCVGKLIVNYAFSHLKIRWNKDIALTAIHERNLYNIRHDIVYMILRMIDVKEYVKVNKEKISLFTELFNKIERFEDIKALNTINENEFYSILCILLDNR